MLKTWDLKIKILYYIKQESKLVHLEIQTWEYLMLARAENKRSAPEQMSSRLVKT